MKTYKQMKFDTIGLKEGDTWYPIRKETELEEDDYVRTPDGLVKVVSVNTDKGNFYGEVITPIHDDVIKGETYEYSTRESQILAKRVNKNKVSVNDLLSIDDEDGKHKSPAKYNPIVMNPTLEHLDKMIKEELKRDDVNEKKSLTQTMTRGLALVLKRRVVKAGNKVRESGDTDIKLDALSYQVSALAGLTLLSTSVSGDGLLSKAAIVSGLMTSYEHNKGQRIYE